MKITRKSFQAFFTRASFAGLLLGGVATFAPITDLFAGTILTGATVTVDVSPTLSQINFNSPIQHLPHRWHRHVDHRGEHRLTVNTVGTATNIAIGNGPSISIAFGSQITRPSRAAAPLV